MNRLHSRQWTLSGNIARRLTWLILLSVLHIVYSELSVKFGIFLGFFEKVGNHIDVLTGKWTALDSGIGAGVDSYFEYLVKGAVLFQYPQFIEQFRGKQVFHLLSQPPT